MTSIAIRIPHTASLLLSALPATSPCFCTVVPRRHAQRPCNPVNATLWQDRNSAALRLCNLAAILILPAIRPCLHPSLSVSPFPCPGGECRYPVPLILLFATLPLVLCALPCSPVFPFAAPIAILSQPIG
ncbi:hypothetical protein B0I35DRAFT_102674 [Stachybotrys elegans]|uniref:Uncharacterized protein n=1 Tax=Stachybotrys elegans TaxID=80388 RepID=A0A8K0WL07_9HYPO|nr:hypothetical protein B0I35DRAFT_102674 [Stachybotrys elegans]